LVGGAGSFGTQNYLVVTVSEGSVLRFSRGWESGVAYCFMRRGGSRGGLSRSRDEGPKGPAGTIGKRQRPESVSRGHKSVLPAANRSRKTRKKVAVGRN